MASSAKRVLTDETHNSSIASNATHQRQETGSMIAPYLAERLRSLGSRVRKNVVEGYISSPPSFSKSNSTGNIFRSSNDTLRDIYPLASTNTPGISPRKRTRRQFDQGYNSDGGLSEEDGDADMEANGDLDEGVSIILGPDARSLGRPVKALRKPRRTMLTTCSLPNGSLRMGGEVIDNDSIMKGTEEEDWSMIAAHLLRKLCPLITVVHPNNAPGAGCTAHFEREYHDLYMRSFEALGA
ncbi:hypothetical protein Hypma_010211 [Hypsizygus marmoreus]|uniref:Uncharacterized protein n=1 Tax=Hypsizygus marmoreus TaxID=39966 RepID=A0A369JPW0_HYPMA|nr:hypothetical protein Hypma_010211 [Hypsizygus marmoreus]